MTVVGQEVAKVRKAEVRRALKRMKRGKAVGPDPTCGCMEISQRVFEFEFLTRTLNKI